MRWLGVAVALLALRAVAASDFADALESAWARLPQTRALAATQARLLADSQLAAGLTPAPAAVSLSALNDRLASRRGRDEWEAELGVPVWLPGQQDARYAAAEREKEFVRAQTAVAKLELAGELRESWWRVPAEQVTRRLAQERFDAARQLEADVERRFRAGELARADANLARHERLLAESAVAEADLALAEATRSVQRLTGSAPPGSFVAEPDPRAPSLHPRLVMLIAQRDLAQAKLRAAQFSARDAPEVAVRVVRERSEYSEPHATALGVRLKIPFASPARASSSDAAARAELLQVEAEIERDRLAIEQSTSLARLRLDTAVTQQQRAQEQHRLMQDNLTLAQRAHALGESDLPTLLRARERAHAAALAAEQADVALAAARARLNQALGVLP